MKKLFLLMAGALMSIGMFAQDPFVGFTKQTMAMHYENNLDVLVDRVKTSIENNPNIDAASKGMAKMMAKPIVKNQLKQLEMMKYITSLPEGEWTVWQRWDGVNNRIVNFVPELGRIVSWDGNSGTVIVAYPNLKIASKETNEAYKTEQFKYSCNYTPLPEGVEIEEINGFEAVPNYGLAPYDENSEVEESEIIEVYGQKYIKIPAPGYKLVEYGMMVQHTMNTEFYSQETNMLSWGKEPIPDSDFVIPADYKLVNTTDELIKALKKPIKAGTLAIPYDKERLPESIWDVAK